MSESVGVWIRAEAGAWNVWNLDTQGTAAGGYEINDRSYGGPVNLPVDPTDDDVITALQDAEYLNPARSRASYTVEFASGGLITIATSIDGEPLCQLEQALT